MIGSNSREKRERKRERKRRERSERDRGKQIDRDRESPDNQEISKQRNKAWLTLAVDTHLLPFLLLLLLHPLPLLLFLFFAATLFLLFSEMRCEFTYLIGPNISLYRISTSSFSYFFYFFFVYAPFSWRWIFPLMNANFLPFTNKTLFAEQAISPEWALVLHVFMKWYPEYRVKTK